MDKKYYGCLKFVDSYGCLKLVGLVTILMMGPVAQADEGFIASGTIQHYENTFESDGPSTGTPTLVEGTFAVSVVLDASAPLAGSMADEDFAYAQWRDSVISMSVIVLDGEGVERLSAELSQTLDSESFSGNTTFSDIGTLEQSLWQTKIYYADSQANASILFNNPTENGVSPDLRFPGIPDLLAGDAEFQYDFYGLSDAIHVTGEVTAIEALGSGSNDDPEIPEEEPGSLDSDGDGVEDSLDHCPASFISETVIIGNRDTGVANSIDAQGCSITDLIAACAVSVKNHGQFVRCVSKVNKELKAGGVISGAQKGRIQSAAARAR